MFRFSSQTCSCRTDELCHYKVPGGPVGHKLFWHFLNLRRRRHVNLQPFGSCDDLTYTINFRTLLCHAFTTSTNQVMASWQPIFRIAITSKIRGIKKISRVAGLNSSRPLRTSVVVFRATRWAPRTWWRQVDWNLRTLSVQIHFTTQQQSW